MTLIAGHRGARNLWAENSRTGFLNLRQMPVEAVEFDIHLDGAGEIVVIHDATLDRTTDHAGPVSALPAGAHRQVLLKDGHGDTIPTLADVLDIYKETPFELHIELKTDANALPYAGLEAKTIALVTALGIADRCVLTSFDLGVLQTLKTLAPHIRRLSSYDRKGADRDGVLVGLQKRLDLVDILAVEKSLLGAHWDIFAQHVPLERLGAWVTNTPADLEKWMSCGLRQITTDNPDVALAVRKALTV
ncbi:glycerophosphoryl diester phosphodiesterase [Ketogulonicigenium robustum]|uniref:Glycerophosphoryl diester phosphodiesterase n=1 Tax=Ketogulonicigenium robustum TaxID=92947 RepID=A0A1W6P176_9RHOB|nr:glycerophosphodiester phosphodiesterase family protein [Ketogulonicigenium robustum]ARO15262.1 glycerophosphoryl diester phosphodiesterase [Ketogulonicigenium robustum]